MSHISKNIVAEGGTVEMEVMVVTVDLFLAERVVKERMEVTVVTAGMVEAVDNGGDGGERWKWW